MVEQIEQAIERFRDCKVLVIGDIILDEYIFGVAERISPEAPVPIVLERSRMAKLGGAANVALNIKMLGAEVELLGVIGDDRAGDTVVELLYGYDIDPHGVVRDPERPTTLKQRIIAQKQQVLRLDSELRENIPEGIVEKLVEKATERLNSVDVVVFSDYDKGTLSPFLIKKMLSLTEGKVRLVDPKRKHFWDYKGVEVFKPNLKELSAALGTQFEPRVADNLVALAKEAAERLAVKHLLVTLGEHGMLLLRDASEPVWIPAMKIEVFDVTGAGDTVAAVTALGIAAGLELEKAALLASIAAGIEVMHLGVTAVKPDELSRFVRANWDDLYGFVGEPPSFENNENDVCLRKG